MPIFVLSLSELGTALLRHVNISLESSDNLLLFNICLPTILVSTKFLNVSFLIPRIDQLLKTTYPFGGIWASAYNVNS